MAVASPTQPQQEAGGSRQTFPFLAALERSHVPSAILLPETGELTWMNPAAETLVGDIRGKKWYDTGVLTNEGASASWDAWVKTVEGGLWTTTTYETTIKTVAGVELPVSASMTLMDAGGVPVVFRQFYPKPVEAEKGEAHKRVLTKRQLEILKLIALGASTSEIAQSLYLSNATVKTHVRRILAALKVSSRAQAVACAYREGLL